MIIIVIILDLAEELAVLRRRLDASGAPEEEHHLQRILLCWLSHANLCFIRCVCSCLLIYLIASKQMAEYVIWLSHAKVARSNTISSNTTSLNSRKASML